MISFYLDNILINDTPDYKELAEIIELDKDLKAWIHKYSAVELKFSGDGYNYIKNIKSQYGYNYRIEVKIVITGEGMSGTGDVIEGYIYMTDIDIHHTKKTISAPLVEKFFLGTIKQNQKADIYFDGLEKTLNGLTLDLTPTEDSVEMFKPLDGSALFDIQGIELVSAISSAVGYITDNSVNFRDDYFDTTFGKFKYLLVNGNQLRTQDTSVLRVKTRESFQNLMTNVFKLFNVWWYIDYSTLKPTFVIDHYDNIMNSTGGITMNNVKNMEESFNQDDFYTSINIGSEKNQKPPLLNYTEYLQFISGYTHHKESYTAKNNTMIDNEFNLVTDWIIDHNIIQHILVVGTSATDYDENNYLIQYDNVYMTATEFTFANIEADTRRLYNEGLTNVKRLDRFTLPIELGFDLGITDNNFEANKSTDIFYTAVTAVSTTTATFDTEILDPNNNYNNATYRYTCPPTIIGYYGFEFHLQTVFSGIPAPYTIGSPSGYDIRYTPCVRITMTIYNKFASGTTKQSNTEQIYITANTGIEGILSKCFANFYMCVGDYAYCEYSMTCGHFEEYINIWTPVISFISGPLFSFDCQIIGSSSRFKTAFVQNQGGTVLTSSDIRKYNGGIIKYKNNLSLDVWKALKQNSIQTITATTGDGRMVETKIKKVERKILSGETTFELITKESKVGL